MIALYELSQNQSIQIGTSDIVPLVQADVIVFINLPSNRPDVEKVRRSYPNARLVLIASESPVIQPHAAVTSNHDLFDLVFASSRLSTDYIKYRILPPGCAYVPEFSETFISFKERRFAILVNSNINSGILRTPRPWKIFDKLISIRKGGWYLPFLRFWQVSHGSLYHCRRSFAKAAADLRIHDFDIYGQNWEPLRSGWFYRFFPEKPIHNWRGLLKADKLLTLCRYKFTFCYENFEGDEGYISEKIFDALAAGSVPLCLGDRNLKRWIPANCAVFRGDYPNDRAMLIDLLDWSEDRWMAYRNAGQEFLYSDKAKPFLPDAFADGILEGIKSLFKPNGNQEALL